MKKPLSALNLFLAILLPISCAADTPSEPQEKPAVENVQVAPEVTETQKSEPAGEQSPEDTGATPEADVEKPKEVMLADFEGDGFTNNFEGESGAWNLNPDDEDRVNCEPELDYMAGVGGVESSVLKLNYRVDSPLPAQNGFWTKLRNFDATDYDELHFDVKGDTATGFTSRFKIELKKYKSQEERTEKIKGTAEIPVTGQWQTVKIKLNKMTGVIDFADPAAWQNPGVARKNLDEFVIVFQDRHVDVKKGTIYIDNIKFVHSGIPGPTAVDFPPRKIEKTPVKLEGVEFAKFLIKRLGGFPEKVSVKKEFPADDKAFIMEIAKDTWRFFDEIVDQEHGLPLDTIQLGETEPLGEGSWVGDYTNVTNIGVYFMVLVSAYDLGFITREEAVRRIRLTMDTVEKIEHHSSGFPYNYYDTTTLERTSYFVSLVDSGWLVAGLYVAKNAFPEELTEQAQRMIDRGNFKFFYDPVERQMRHGYYDNLEVYSDYHYGAFYTEPRASSYIAIARGEVPTEHWFEGLIRTFPEDYFWQQQTPTDRVERTTLGHTYFGGYYEWNGIKYVPSWGGSSFEALMPTLIMKEKELAPEGLGANNAAHVQGQIRFALEEAKQPVWGMSPSSWPEGGYSEFGATAFGSKGYKTGVVTPHAVVLGLEYAPKEVVANLRKLIELYDIYGEYGFYDAVTVTKNPDKENSREGLIARKYLALDQAMIFVAINNYINAGAIRERFHADPVMKKAENLLSSEKFFEKPAPAAAPAEEAAAA